MTIQDTLNLKETLTNLTAPLIPEGFKIDIKIVRKDIHEDKERQLKNAKDINDYTCLFFGKKPEYILRKDRRADVVLIRKMSCYMNKSYTSLTLREIGSFCNYDHSDVLAAIDTLNNWSKTDTYIKEKISELNSFITSHINF